MAFKRSAVRSRLSPPTQKALKTLCFQGFLHLYPSFGTILTTEEKIQFCALCMRKDPPGSETAAMDAEHSHGPCNNCFPPTQERFRPTSRDEKRCNGGFVRKISSQCWSLPPAASYGAARDCDAGACACGFMYDRLL